MQEIPEASRNYVSSLIKSYYKERPAEEIAPSEIQKKEFGFGTFDAKIKYRHLSFNSPSELKAYLVLHAPPYASCSTAYYRFPAGRPMENKQWLGSELVFDLDATDMNLNCQMVHGKQWICKDCLKAVKNETIKLIENFLIPDFGFSEKEIEINFSGNRGYHVHIKRESVLSLDADARSAISNYISGAALNVEEFFPTSYKRGVPLIGPRPTDRGWAGKMAKAAISGINDGTSLLISLGVTKQVANNMYKKRALIEMGIRNGNWDMVYIKNKADFWKKILKNQAIMQSDRIDKNVTKDPTHLLRLPNTLHGDTALIAKKIRSLSELTKFNPMVDAIAFHGAELEVTADTSYELLINNESFGPYPKKTIPLPVYAALYLYLKGLAQINIAGQ